MKKRKNKTTGKFTISLEALYAMDESYSGMCVECGEVQEGGCEPDARNYKCEACGKLGVFGYMELMTHPKVTIK